MFNTSLPTDNLYKFMAIAGLSIIFFSFYLAFNRVESLWERLDQGMRQSDKLSEEIAQLRIKEKTIQEVMDRRIVKYEIGKRQLQLSDAMFATDRFYKMTLWILDRVLIALCCGCFFTALGFTLWYTRVQRPLDIAIKTQAKRDLADVINLDSRVGSRTSAGHIRRGRVVSRHLSGQIRS
jgi:hypothetical protein